MRAKGAEQSEGHSGAGGTQHGEPEEGRGAGSSGSVSTNTQRHRPRDGPAPPPPAESQVTASTLAGRLPEPWPGKAAGNGKDNRTGGATGRRAGTHQIVESWNCLGWKGP